MTQLHTAVYRRSGGRLLSRLGHQPVLLLTTTGRRSGRIRTTPVQYLARVEDLLIVGANHGAPHAPAWALNLRAEPLAQVQIGSELRAVHARAVTGRERTELWHELSLSNRLLPSVETKAGRPLDVFVLEPRAVPAAPVSFAVPSASAVSVAAGSSH